MHQQVSTLLPLDHFGFGQKAKGKANNGHKYRVACGNGHEYVAGSFSIDKDGTRRCLVCKRASRQRALADPRRAPKLREAKRLQATARRAKLKGISLEDVETEDDNIKATRLAYLKMNGVTAQASDTLAYAIESKGRPKCEADPDSYVEWDERLPPTRLEAIELCSGCPVIAECLAFAKALKPDGLVMGAYSWTDGRANQT